MLCVNEYAFLYIRDFHSVECQAFRSRDPAFFGIQNISSNLLFHNHFGDCSCFIVFVSVILLSYT